MSEIPARYVPKLPFVAAPRAQPEERIEVGVPFVGAGPAGLAGAIRLAQRLAAAPGVKERLGEVAIAVVEKGKYPGAHLVSGAVVDPLAFHELFPELSASELPFRCPVEKEALYLLTRRRALRAPLMPPTMRNHGNHVTSRAPYSTRRRQRAGVHLDLAPNTTRACRCGVFSAAHSRRGGGRSAGTDKPDPANTRRAAADPRCRVAQCGRDGRPTQAWRPTAERDCDSIIDRNTGRRTTLGSVAEQVSGGRPPVMPEPHE